MIASLAAALVLAAASDPIGDALSAPATPPATLPPTAPLPPPPTAAPVPPPPVAAPPPRSVGPPRQLDDLSRPLSGAVPQGRYEAGLAGAFAASENLQGALDGAWEVKGADGRPLLRLQITDPGYRGGRVEGAWRDLRSGSGATDNGGFITSAGREEGRLVIRFSHRGQPAVLTLEPRGTAWAGTLAEGGSDVRVSLVRPGS